MAHGHADVSHASTRPARLPLPWCCQTAAVSAAAGVSISQRYQTIDALISDLSAYLTSGEIDKEKPEQDRSTELLEIFQKNSIHLSSQAPPWPYADIGICKLKSSSKLGLYYDLFPLPEERLLILIAEPLEQGVEALFPAANLRGVVRTLILESTKPMDPPFQTLSFIQALQRQIQLDPFISKFAFSYLHLSPIEGKVHFYNSGLSQIIYTPAGEKSHTLYNSHPPLTQTSTEFTETSENWNIGDVIIYHDFILEEKDSIERKEAVENHLVTVLQKQMFHSAQSQADILVKELSQSSLFPKDEQTKVLFSIQRVN